MIEEKTNTELSLQWCSKCKGFHKKIVALHLTTGVFSNPLQIKLHCLNCSDETYVVCSIAILKEDSKINPPIEYKKFIPIGDSPPKLEV